MRAGSIISLQLGFRTKQPYAAFLFLSAAQAIAEHAKVKPNAGHDPSRVGPEL
jgi:hypothetical protein